MEGAPSVAATTAGLAVLAEHKTLALRREQVFLLESLLAIVLVLALVIYTRLTTIQERKLIKLIDSNLVTLHLIAALITSSVIPSASRHPAGPFATFQ